jgi:hypothetical protein
LYLAADSRFLQTAQQKEDAHATSVDDRACSLMTENRAGRHGRFGTSVCAENLLRGSDIADPRCEDVRIGCKRSLGDEIMARCTDVTKAFFASRML